MSKYLRARPYVFVTKSGLFERKLIIQLVTWDTIIIHWLTFGSSAEAEKNLTCSTQASTRVPLTQDLAIVKDGVDYELGLETSTNKALEQPTSVLMSAAGAVDLPEHCTADIIISAPLRGG